MGFQNQQESHLAHRADGGCEGGAEGCAAFSTHMLAHGT